MRFWMSLSILGLMPACSADLLATSQREVRQGSDEHYEHLRCDPNLCLLHTEKDTDGDGIADIDELAIGADPRDPWNHPEISDLAGLLPSHSLPSFEIGNSMLVLLPTTNALGLPVYGGEAMMPARKSALEQAGIKLPAGFDLSHGLSISRTVTDSRPTVHPLLWGFEGSTAARTTGQVATGLGSFGKDLTDVK